MAEMIMKSNWGDFEPNPVSVWTEISDGKIFGKKKNWKKRNSAKNCDFSGGGNRFPDDTRKSSSFRRQDCYGFSKIGNQGDDGVRSNACLGGILGSHPSTVLQCIKAGLQDSDGSACGDTKKRYGRGCNDQNGKENRYLGCHWQNSRWVKEPSYRYKVKLVHSLKNSALPEDIGGIQPATVLQCSEVEIPGSDASVYEDTRKGSATACALNGKGNRYSGCRPQNARYAERHWVKEPSYRYGAKNVHILENYSAWAGSQHRLNGGLYRYFSQPSCKLRKDVTLRATKMSWRPARTKESRPMEWICSADTCSASILNIPVLSKEMDINLLETSSIPFSSSATFSDTKCTSSISCPQVISAYDDDHPKLLKSAAETGPRIESKFCGSKGKMPKDTNELLIGSQRTVKTLSLSYRMQLASEIVQLTMGYPLVEFERFVHCAAPVIAASYLSKRCSVCLDNHLSHSFICKHQIPNLPLSTVWNWYKKPGNYGLDVKADDSKNLSGPKSFHAYFFPSLSAVQLFQPHNRDSKTLYSRHSSEAAMLNRMQAGTENFDSITKPFGSFGIVLGNRSGPFGLDCLPDSELVFEYFESEQPQQRKPFYNKVLELIGGKTSNHHMFGDPSKLGCLNLCDLHPASWFSVAWYPIYRIPEGKFRASFLTYHSLGYLVQRPVSTDASNKYTSHIFFPVLGLQSYNAQGECWFDSRIPNEYSSKESTSSNNAEIFKKRLRTLEDNALHFARGLVCKDKVTVSNRHPDYEFFISRKPHYK